MCFELGIDSKFICIYLQLLITVGNQLVLYVFINAQKQKLAIRPDAARSIAQIVCNEKCWQSDCVITVIASNRVPLLMISTIQVITSNVNVERRAYYYYVSLAPTSALLFHHHHVIIINNISQCPFKIFSLLFIVSICTMYRCIIREVYKWIWLKCKLMGICVVRQFISLFAVILWVLLMDDVHADIILVKLCIKHIKYRQTLANHIEHLNCVFSSRSHCWHVMRMLLEFQTSILRRNLI